MRGLWSRALFHTLHLTMAFLLSPHLPSTLHQHPSFSREPLETA